MSRLRDDQKCLCCIARDLGIDNAIEEKVQGVLVLGSGYFHC